MKKFVYADNAATTPLSETAFEAMKPWLTEYYGNPSSLYRIGRAAKEALNEARATVGKRLNAAMPVNEANDYAPGEIIFTAGGSQADNLAIRGFIARAGAKGRKHIVTSKITSRWCCIPARRWKRRAFASHIWMWTSRGASIWSSSSAS